MTFPDGVHIHSHAIQCNSGISTATATFSDGFIRKLSHDYNLMICIYYQLQNYFITHPLLNSSKSGYTQMDANLTIWRYIEYADIKK